MHIGSPASGRVLDWSAVPENVPAAVTVIPPPDAYCASFKLHEEDIDAWYQLNLFVIIAHDKRFLRRLITPAAYCAMAITGSILSSTTRTADDLKFAYLLIPVYWFVMCWRYKRRLLRRMRAARRGFPMGAWNVWLWPEGFGFQNGETGITYRWDELQSVTASKGHLFLVLPAALWVIPRKCFTPHQWIELLQRFATFSRLPFGCPACKYNLTGSTGGRCPECGYPELS